MIQGGPACSYQSCLWGRSIEGTTLLVWKPRTRGCYPKQVSERKGKVSVYLHNIYLNINQANLVKSKYSISKYIHDRHRLLFEQVEIKSRLKIAETYTGTKQNGTCFATVGK